MLPEQTKDWPRTKTEPCPFCGEPHLSTRRGRNRVRNTFVPVTSKYAYENGYFYTTAHWCAQKQAMRDGMKPIMARMSAAMRKVIR